MRIYLHQSCKFLSCLRKPLLAARCFLLLWSWKRSCDIFTFILTNSIKIANSGKSDRPVFYQITRPNEFCFYLEKLPQCFSTEVTKILLKLSSRKSCSICLFMWVFFFYWCGVSQWLIFICYNILVTLELIQLYHGAWSSLLLDSVY